ncbi:hypothetical protein [Salinithrix halophila]|uniref:Uncharacterized protein n=1 Tax=Salinithrix halophila TaxID=1485204 RepID=A0ABV8JHP0_9BACL
MIRERRRQVRYYERFQVEDALTFFNGQLIQARSPDGARVLLQEIKLVRPLPPGAQEMLGFIHHPHLLSVLDVIVEQDVVVLVHPIFSGEPLPLVVNREQPMPPSQAVNLFRKLIQTQADLAEFSIPMWTTLDPRNICLYDDEPFVLFCGLKNFTTQPKEDQRKSLLYFLLAGEHPKNVMYRRQDLSKSIRKVPPPIRHLALDILNHDDSLDEILRKTDETLSQLPQKMKASSRSNRYKRRLSPAATAAASLLILGASAGTYSAATSGILSEEVQPAEGPQKPEVQETFQFNKEEVAVRKLSEKVPFSARIEGEVIRQTASPFSVRLASPDGTSCGINVDKQGKVRLFQHQDENLHELQQSDDSFRMKAGRAYRVELLYFSGDPLRISVEDRENNQKWVAVGTIPLDKGGRVEVEGSKGTVFRSAQVTAVAREDKAKQKWMDSQRWKLLSGEGTLDKERFFLDGNAIIKARSGRDTDFAFRRDQGYTGDPLKLQLESADGSRYYVVWGKDKRLVLYREGEEEKALAETKLGWTPDRKTDVSVLTQGSLLTVRLNQDTQSQSLEYSHSEPITIRNTTITSQSDLELSSH